MEGGGSLKFGNLKFGLGKVIITGIFFLGTIPRVSASPNEAAKAAWQTLGNTII